MFIVCILIALVIFLLNNNFLKMQKLSTETLALKKYKWLIQFKIVICNNAN